MKKNTTQVINNQIANAYSNLIETNIEFLNKIFKSELNIETSYKMIDIVQEIVKQVNIAIYTNDDLCENAELQNSIENAEDLLENYMNKVLDLRITNLID